MLRVKKLSLNVLVGKAQEVKIKDTQTGLMAFMCHHHKTKDPVKTAADMNRDLEAAGINASVFVPEAGKWITVGNYIEFDD